MRHAHNYYPPFLREDGNKVMLRNKPPADDKHQWDTGQGVAEVKVDYSPNFIEDKAIEFIEQNKDNPFYLYYCPTMPHTNNEGDHTRMAWRSTHMVSSTDSIGPRMRRASPAWSDASTSASAVFAISSRSSGSTRWISGLQAQFARGRHPHPFHRPLA
jgi:hypothetical protein